MIEPHIIRTVLEVKGLDPATVFIDRNGNVFEAKEYYSADSKFFTEPVVFPAVVLVTGEYLRAASAALQEAIDE